jgi:desulfoferrodoxin-like iron-binding protein
LSKKEGLVRFRSEIEAKAKSIGYSLNPDPEFLEDLFDGLFKNQERYGYPSCPCRLAEGDLRKDIDIICPCVYRDPDLFEYGRCYCALYVNENYVSGKMGAGPIPERRPEKRAVITKVGDRVGVKEVGERYKCNICGNEVTATNAGGGVLICCGEEMELIGK